MSQFKDTRFLFKILNDHSPSQTLSDIHAESFLQSLHSDLRSSPYSYIFQSKVSKKEAPGYYDIIKTPMDLSLMARKLKNYSLPAFFDDAELIWKNCEIFNAKTEYFLECAEAMRKKTESLKAYYFGEEDECLGFEVFNLKPTIVSKSSCVRKKVVKNILLRVVIKVLLECGFNGARQNVAMILMDFWYYWILKKIERMKK